MRAFAKREQADGRYITSEREFQGGRFVVILRSRLKRGGNGRTLKRRKKKH